MSRIAVIRLVKSLSKPEKRHFKLSAKKQSGNKDYLDLFDMIDQCKFMDTTLLENEFRKLHPGSSLDNAARYLLKMITDCLIQSKIKEDNLFRQLQGLMRVNILQERALPEEGYRELQRLLQSAISSQNHFMQFIIYRYQLDYLTDLNFHGLTEKSVVEMQMKARDVLKGIRNIHEHHSLYELLKYRLIHSGKILSEDAKKQLNDLLLSEMSLVTGRVKNNFESRKLHLFFQSFFFTDIGDYKSALKTSNELNRLFEQNKPLWNRPPLDYLSSLDGILDSLRTIGRYDEMILYIKQTEQLDDPSYPEYFRFIVRKTAMIYQLTVLMGNGKFEAALQLISRSDRNLLEAYSMVDDEKQSELLFCLGLAYFGMKNFKKAQKYINEIVLTGKINYQSIIYKASRLLHILIHYENKNLEYLDYEIRSYTRVFKSKQKLLKIERLIFKIIKINPDFNNTKKNNMLWVSIVPLVKEIRNDRYERQLLKYFDFTGWIERRFEKEQVPG